MGKNFAREKAALKFFREKSKDTQHEMKERHQKFDKV